MPDAPACWVGCSVLVLLLHDVGTWLVGSLPYVNNAQAMTERAKPCTMPHWTSLVSLASHLSAGVHARVWLCRMLSVLACHYVKAPSHARHALQGQPPPATELQAS